jgi:hypothetical protein
MNCKPTIKLDSTYTVERVFRLYAAAAEEAFAAAPQDGTGGAVDRFYAVAASPEELRSVLVGGNDPDGVPVCLYRSFARGVARLRATGNAGSGATFCAALCKVRPGNRVQITTDQLAPPPPLPGKPRPEPGTGWV